MALADKGTNVDVLVMTATPIPRAAAAVLTVTVKKNASVLTVETPAWGWEGAQEQVQKSVREWDGIGER